MEQIKILTEEAALSAVAPLFECWEETLIWTALQGMMGQVWCCADSASAWGTPVVACCETGDFVFPAGDATSPYAKKLLEALKEKQNGRFAILTPRDEQWSRLIQDVFGENAKAGERYAICKDGDCFDRRHLETLAQALPAGVTLAPIDGERYEMVMNTDWARDFCSQFADKEDFARQGLGVVALRDGQLIGGASSYIRYRDGIEIEVDTRSDCRRMGIASACCARLILDCLERGLYPSWDAANRMSVSLAEKLGYRERGSYPVWYINLRQTT
ncbi:MAG: GNAT family N-acetyltransferase [Clostridiales bacterium]|nr:GNAT family N-acetyltransferase [Clostridiales bacterium]